MSGPGFPPSGKNLENSREFGKKGQNQGKISEFKNTFWKNQGKKFSMLCELYVVMTHNMGAVCLIVGGEGVAIRDGIIQESTFKNKDHIFYLSQFIFDSHQSWKVLENSGEIRGNSGNLTLETWWARGPKRVGP